MSTLHLESSIYITLHVLYHSADIFTRMSQVSSMQYLVLQNDIEDIYVSLILLMQNQVI